MCRHRRRHPPYFLKDTSSGYLEVEDRNVRWCIYLFGGISGLSSSDFSEEDVQSVYHVTYKMNSSNLEFDNQSVLIPSTSDSLDDVIFKINSLKSFVKNNNQLEALTDLIILGIYKILELWKTDYFSKTNSNIQYYTKSIYEAIISLRYICNLLKVSIASLQLFQSFWSTSFKVPNDLLYNNYFNLLTITPQLPANYYVDIMEIYSKATYTGGYPFCPPKQLSDVITGECVNFSIWKILILLIFSTSDMSILLLNLLELVNLKIENIKKEMSILTEFILYLRNLSESSNIVVYNYSSSIFHIANYVYISKDVILTRFSRAFSVLDYKKFLLSASSNKLFTEQLFLNFKNLLYEISALIENFEANLPFSEIYFFHFLKFYYFIKKRSMKKSIVKHLQENSILAGKLHDVMYNYLSKQCKVITPYDYNRLGTLFGLDPNKVISISLGVFGNKSLRLLERTLVSLYILLYKPQLVNFLQAQLDVSLKHDLGRKGFYLLSSLDIPMESDLDISEKLVRLSGELKNLEVSKRMDFLRSSLEAIFKNVPDSTPLIQTAKILQSAERTPFILKYKTDEGVIAYIYKYDDNLSHDLLVMQFIYVFRDIFSLKGLDLYLHPYYIKPIICSDGVRGGVFRAIDGVKSRQEIIDTKLTLEEYYRKTFDSDPSYDEAVSNFISSLAAYSLVCYLFDIKDRNNGNILITNRGYIIHIDFGFIMGRSPGGDLKFELAPFKLDKDMIQLLGNSLNSDNIRKLTNLMVKGFLALRDYHGYLMDLLELHRGDEFECINEKSIEKFKRRLGVGLTIPQCEEMIKKCIIQAYGSKTTLIYDWMQSLQNKSKVKEWQAYKKS